MKNTTKAGTRPGRVVYSTGPKAKEQAKHGEVANVFRRQHGDISEQNLKAPDGDRLEVARVSIDSQIAWIAKALKDGKLAPAQAAAADKAAIMFRTYGGSPSGRSCIDFSVRGSGGSHSAAQATAGVELKVLQAKIGWVRYAVLRGVLWLDEPTGDRRTKDRRWRLIVEGLDGACDVWKIG